MGRTPRAMVPLLVLLLVGCASLPSSGAEDPFAAASWEGGRRPEVRIEVYNQLSPFVSLYAVGGPYQRASLGTVEKQRSRSFRLPWENRVGLQVEIALVDGTRFRTPPLVVGPGQSVYLVVEKELTASRLRES